MSEPYSIGKLTRKRSDGTSYWSYTIQWTPEGEDRRRVSLGTTDKAAAATLAREFWAKHTVGPADTIGAVVEAYLETLPKTYPGWRRNGVNDPVLQSRIKGAHRKREGWSRAKPFWGKLLLSQVDAETSKDYMRWRGRAANTMRHELGPIQTALKWAVERNMIVKAPPVKLPAIPESSVGHLSKAQFKAFLEQGCTSPHVSLFAVLAVTTGARTTALLQLPWKAVDLDKGIIRLRPEGIADRDLKGRATIPINDRLRPMLAEAKAGATSDYVIEYKGHPIASIQTAIKASSVRSGIDVHPHKFRHSAAVWMAEDRVPMEEIAAYLGHRDVGITVRTYARYSPDYLRRASRSLDW